VIHDFATPKTLVLVDPVMGDNGEIYKTYTTQMCDKMKDLCHAANIITPNITEACILTGRDYNLAFDQNELLSILSDLLKLCGTSKKAVVITGIKKGNEIGAYYYDGFTENGKIGSVYAPYCDKFFPGCGDILASMLLGKVLLGEKLASALATAVNFISETSFYTDSLGTPGREGLVFEERLQMQ
ncbi:MAG: bifunctional hydroxymethylpyrimidine kinase/phosphomethylpyrimidine kinase, partial [Clostridia bacterium]